jgi:small subunit ribosomal protein S10e
MLMPKETRKKIHQYLFQEGVLVAKKDFNGKHPEIDVPNLHVVKALQSLQSRGFVNSRFSWQYFYYYLTNEGIEFLRAELHLPPEIVPRTFIKTSTKPLSRPERREPSDRAPRQQQEYRRADKNAAAPADFKPDFHGGVGRGATRQ